MQKSNHTTDISKSDTSLNSKFNFGAYLQPCLLESNQSLTSATAV